MKKIIFILLLLICPVLVSAEQIDINSASLSQLDELAGIGPVYAQRIIDSRPYSSVDELDKVKGIGPATLQKIKDQGFACVNCSTPAVGVTPDVTPTATTTAEAPEPEIVTYPIGVYINEILPNPKGSDETDEWAELYNSNNFDVDLSGWQLQDTIGTATTYTIEQGTKILANSFLVFKRPDTKIMLNNDQDGLSLLTPDKKIIDSVNFVSAPLGQSYSKIGSVWQWNTNLTQGSKNTILLPSKTSSLPNSKISDKNSDINLATASLSQTANLNQTSNPWLLFFTVLASTIVLATIVLFIKFRFTDVTKT